MDLNLHVSRLNRSFVYLSIDYFRNFVPISLIVTLEIVKYWQGMFMSWDVDMFDVDQSFAMKAHTTSINEELGQIEYIFSDKTGTLTCNIMEFKKFSTTAGAFVIPDEKDQAMANNAPITGINFAEPMQPEEEVFKVGKNNVQLSSSTKTHLA